MATIHRTTLSPGKLELLAAWLPGQRWYRDAGSEPDLSRAGGFRLDDPDGEVGIEFMVVTDGSGGSATSYLVPLTYRAAPLAGADAGLITTAEHGVLGQRWIYDGLRDPVLVAQLVALIQGAAEAQAQGVSDTPDPTVVGCPVSEAALVTLTSAVTGNGPDGTELRAETVDADGMTSGRVTLAICRVLQPADGPEPAGAGISATWQLADGRQARGTFVTARYDPAPAT